MPIAADALIIQTDAEADTFRRLSSIVLHDAVFFSLRNTAACRMRRRKRRHIPRRAALHRIPCERTLIGNESVPIQLVQCRFPGLPISNAKIFINIYFK